MTALLWHKQLAAADLYFWGMLHGDTVISQEATQGDILSD